MLQVKVISHTPEPEKTVAAAARLCYSAQGAMEIMEDLTPEKVEEFIARLLEMGHESPLEHTNFVFAVEGVSRALTHQLVRHRIASYSQKSQRYVSENNFKYIIPPSVAADPELKKYYEEQMGMICRAYARLNQLVPSEDARYILPNACETNIVVTMNARSLLNFFRLRCCFRAQWEIRRLATNMLREVRKIAPILFQKAGAPCIADGLCPEGEFSCGRWENSAIEDDEQNRQTS